jgi:hypothetical protein
VENRPENSAQDKQLKDEQQPHEEKYVPLQNNDEIERSRIIAKAINARNKILQHR